MDQSFKLSSVILDKILLYHFTEPARKCPCSAPVRKVTNYLPDKLTLTRLYFNWLESFEDQLQSNFHKQPIGLFIISCHFQQNFLWNVNWMLWIVGNLVFRFYFQNITQSFSDQYLVKWKIYLKFRRSFSSFTKKEEWKGKKVSKTE